MKKGNRKYNQGYTLSEVIITIMLTMILLTISLPLFSLLKIPDVSSELSVDQLKAVIQWEINQSRTYDISLHSISIINKNHRSIVLEPYNQAFRRTVDGSGHEVLIQDIQAVSFELMPPFIVMEVEIGDEQIQRKIHLPQ